MLFQQLNIGEKAKMWTWRRFVEELRHMPVDPADHIIGNSEQDEPIYGFDFGQGTRIVSLIGGAHADEPAGPNTLYRLTLALLSDPDRFTGLLIGNRLRIIPHINPDGDDANASWINKWPDLPAFLSGMRREPPGRDIEFGYPGMRPENRAAVAFWEQGQPAGLHISLHGMQFSEGYLLLINDEWEMRSRNWRETYGRAMRSEGLSPHDHDRKGEKGFNYMGPGFTSTPKGAAMHRFFMEKGDPETAAKFHKSSMEFHLGRNPEALCLVTEFPLFLVDPSKPDGVPRNYLNLKEVLEKYRAGIPADTRPYDTASLEERFGVRPLPLAQTMKRHLYTLESALALMKEQGR